MSNGPPPQGPLPRTTLPPPAMPGASGHPSLAEVGRRMTPQGAQEYFLRVVPGLEREIADLKRQLEEQRERNDNLSHAMGLLTAQLLAAYAESERLRDVVAESLPPQARSSIPPSAAGSVDRIYRLFRALVELSPQEATEYLVRRKEVHAILTGLRQVLLASEKR